MLRGQLTNLQELLVRHTGLEVRSLAPDNEIVSFYVLSAMLVICDQRLEVDHVFDGCLYLAVNFILGSELLFVVSLSKQSFFGWLGRD
jgi:hypothetical protein